MVALSLYCATTLRLPGVALSVLSGFGIALCYRGFGVRNSEHMTRAIALPVFAVALSGLICAEVAGAKENMFIGTARMVPGPTPIWGHCDDPASDHLAAVDTERLGGDGQGRRLIKPRCFPSYYYDARTGGAGLLTLEGLPLATMGRTVGSFDVLVVFTNTALNRSKLLKNDYVTGIIGAKVQASEIQVALKTLFRHRSLTPRVAMRQWGRAGEHIQFKYDIATTEKSLFHDSKESHREGLRLNFPKYDIVVLIDDIPQSGWGLVRWPRRHPIFLAPGATFRIVINPKALTPSLMMHEILDRMLIVLLPEYERGEEQIVERNGYKYVQTPIINPRTGQNIRAKLVRRQGGTPASFYLAGYMDVDEDGIADCADPVISATHDNVDADLLPDEIDPDLSVAHFPFLWVYQDRSRPIHLNTGPLANRSHREPVGQLRRELWRSTLHRARSRREARRQTQRLLRSVGNGIRTAQANNKPERAEVLHKVHAKLAWLNSQALVPSQMDIRLITQFLESTDDNERHHVAPGDEQ